MRQTVLICPLTTRSYITSVTCETVPDQDDVNVVNRLKRRSLVSMRANKLGLTRLC